MLCQTLGTVLGCWLCCGGVGSPIFFLVSGLLLGKEVERCDLAVSGVFAMRCAEKSPVADVKSLGAGGFGGISYSWAAHMDSRPPVPFGTMVRILAAPLHFAQTLQFSPL